jgi:hypothetical protein
MTTAETATTGAAGPAAAAAAAAAAARARPPTGAAAAVGAVQLLNESQTIYSKAPVSSFHSTLEPTSGDLPFRAFAFTRHLYRYTPAAAAVATTRRR